MLSNRDTKQNLKFIYRPNTGVKNMPTPKKEYLEKIEEKLERIEKVLTELCLIVSEKKDKKTSGLI